MTRLHPSIPLTTFTLLLLLSNIISCHFSNPNINPSTLDVYHLHIPNPLPANYTPLTDQNVANARGVASYASNEFCNRWPLEKQMESVISKYEVQYVTNVPHAFGTYIRCNPPGGEGTNGTFVCNPRDNYVCKETICQDAKEGPDYHRCMLENCPPLGSEDEIGLAFKSEQLEEPIIYFSMPKKSECDSEQQVGNACSWKLTRSGKPASMKQLMDMGFECIEPDTPNKKEVLQKNYELIVQLLD